MLAQQLKPYAQKSAPKVKDFQGGVDVIPIEHARIERGQYRAAPHPDISHFTKSATSYLVSGKSIAAGTGALLAQATIVKGKGLVRKADKSVEDSEDMATSDELAEAKIAAAEARTDNKI